MSSGKSTPGGAPKAMSSRLLTMKFMQRAAASSPTASSPGTPDEPSPKRFKQASGIPASRFDVNELVNRRAIEAAGAEEAAKREAALERQALESGDTRWVLSFKDLNSTAPSPDTALRVVQAGYANIDKPSHTNSQTDDSSDSDDAKTMIGRRTFGKFKHDIEAQHNQGEHSGESNSDGSSEFDDDSEGSSDSDSETGTASRSRRESTKKKMRHDGRSSEKNSWESDRARIASNKRKKVIKLNKLTSLSGRQVLNTGKEKACFKCGGPHLIADCLAKGQPRLNSGKPNAAANSFPKTGGSARKSNSG